MSTSLRPLSPRTEEEYKRALLLAYGKAEPPFNKKQDDLNRWSRTRLIVLRAAMVRAGVDPKSIQLPATWAPPAKLADAPDEEAAQAYEQEAGKLSSPTRELALLPLATGFRADEIANLSREAVKKAARTGELRFIRKRGIEVTLPVEHVSPLLKALLQFDWIVLGDLLSTSRNRITRYKQLHKLVRAVGVKIGLPELRPHLLRAAFATRMDRDGATLPMIAYYLGHASIRTTERYIRPTARDVKRYLRPLST